MHSADAISTIRKALLFAFLFLAMGTWFCIKIPDVVALDEWLTRFLPRPRRRVPGIGSFYDKLLFRTVGAVFIVLGLCLLALVGAAAFVLARPG